MIFAFFTDDSGLMSFASQADAISYAEGIDVEDGVWRFFNDAGVELQPIFVTPNERGRLMVRSGTYALAPSTNTHSVLRDLVAEIRSYEGIVKSQTELLAALDAHVRAAAAQPAVQADGHASGH